LGGDFGDSASVFLHDRRQVFLPWAAGHPQPARSLLFLLLDASKLMTCCAKVR
jgi:hypothetical protein